MEEMGRSDILLRACDAEINFHICIGKAPSSLLQKLLNPFSVSLNYF